MLCAKIDDAVAPMSQKLNIYIISFDNPNPLPMRELYYVTGKYITYIAYVDNWLAHFFDCPQRAWNSMQKYACRNMRRTKSENILVVMNPGRIKYPRDLVQDNA